MANLWVVYRDGDADGIHQLQGVFDSKKKAIDAAAERNDERYYAFEIGGLNDLLEHKNIETEYYWPIHGGVYDVDGERLRDMD